jgi:aminoglycoside 6'-N-acetyltransferase
VAPQVTLRRATAADAHWFELWDDDPDVVAATSDDPAATVAFSGADWSKEIAAQSDVSQYWIAELEGRPIGALQIIDPHLEPTHYWGDVPPNLRAIDIWIGAPQDRGRGRGSGMMRLALTHCFADPRVSAVIIDPLASNVRAHRFYARLGFAPVERRKFGDDDCLVHELTRQAWQRTRGHDESG